ncbi:hypothetical protein H2200_004326 [Cladophialophora chaetospira]|uniref:Uncharacterized protein n=1 Tax=Cladophialophora chaetospira TaxID=386627 RepID=A0AA38XCW8_9EURO|nr:hypothetical protein H2200_004326 [Cladophialophora chaetospira]
MALQPASFQARRALEHEEHDAKTKWLPYYYQHHVPPPTGQGGHGGWSKTLGEIADFTEIAGSGFKAHKIGETMSANKGQERWVNDCKERIKAKEGHRLYPNLLKKEAIEKELKMKKGGGNAGLDAWRQEYLGPMMQQNKFNFPQVGGGTTHEYHHQTGQQHNFPQSDWVRYDRRQHPQPNTEDGNVNGYPQQQNSMPNAGVRYDRGQYPRPGTEGGNVNEYHHQTQQQQNFPSDFGVSHNRGQHPQPDTEVSNVTEHHRQVGQQQNMPPNAGGQGQSWTTFPAGI